MVNYKKMYEDYEGTSIHKGIPEVVDAENELEVLIETITDPALKLALDQAVGKITRAYEMQGFSMGYNVARAGYDTKVI